MFYAAAFALFCVACTILAFTRHPIYGVYFYFSTTYVYAPARWWGGYLPDVRWALLAAAVTAMAIVVHRKTLKPKPLWLAQGPAALLILYVVWMAIQTPWALDLSEHVTGMTQIVKCLLALWFVYRVIDSKERLRDVAFAHVLGCALLGLYAQFTGRQQGRLDGVGGPNLDDANTLAMYLVTGAIVAVGLVITQRSWRRWVSLASLVLITNGFILANSRGAFIGLVAGGLVLALTTARPHRRMFWAFAAVGMIGLVSLMDQTFIDRMFTIEDVASDDENADTSARSRVAVAKAQMQMFVEHPMGIGYRGTVVLSQRYLDRKWLTLGDDETATRSSHSTFLTAMVEQGLPGAVIYGVLVLWVFSAALRIRRLNAACVDPELVTLGASFCAALTVVLVAGISADYLTKEVQFWLYAALLSVFWLAGDARTIEPRGSARPGARRVAA